MTAANQLQDPTRIVQGAVPPADLDAEGALLSAILLEPAELDVCVGKGLLPGHFYADANRRIYESILRLDAAQNPINVVSVAGDLRHQERLDQIGGTPYLAMLADTIPFQVGRIEHHCSVVIDCWRARQVIAIQQTSVASLYHPQGVPYQTLIEGVEQRIWEVAYLNRDSGYETVSAVAQRALGELSVAFQNGGNLLGITTGFSELDKQTTGYGEGQLIIVAARPGAGKSSFARSSLLALTRPPKDGSLPEAAYLHSLEMPKTELALLFVCSVASIEYKKLRLNQLDRHGWDKLYQAARELSGHPLFIDDRPSVTVMELRSNIRKIKREIEIGRIKAKRLGLAAVDYMQLMRGDKGEGREREIAGISQGLKNTAKSEKICMMALSQLNRDVEKRGGGAKGKRPQLSDLRESGSIEMDADAVWFLYREQYYDAAANDDAEVIISKQRSGPTCTVTLVFDGPTTTFRSKALGNEEFDDMVDDYTPDNGRYPDP